MSNVSRCLLLAALPLFLAPACAAPASPDDGEADVASTSQALCFPAVYSGTLQLAQPTLSWSAPVGYENSCDGLFWTETTLAANLGGYSKVAAAVDLRAPTTEAACHNMRFDYVLYGKGQGNWAPVKITNAFGGTWNPSTGRCSMNVTHVLPMRVAKQFHMFMLGGGARSGGIHYPVDHMVALAN